MKMTKSKTAELIGSLMEVRLEIARINDAAGHTVFNPGATDALEAAMIDLGADKDELDYIRNRHGKRYA